MTDLKLGGVVAGFKVMRITHVSEVDADLYELEHIKSGAKLIYLDADDRNKVFSGILQNDTRGQHGRVPHTGALGALRFKKISGKGAFR